MLSATSRKIEQIGPRRAGRIVAAEHAEGGEQDREDEAVAHQVEPEAEQRAAVAVGVLLLLVEDRRRRRRGGAVVSCIGSGPSAASCAVRRLSNRTTSSAGM